MSGPDLLTLIGRDGPLKRKGSTHGGEYVSPCTICRRGKGRPNGRDHFIAWPNAANGPGKPPGRWACLGPKAGRSGCDLSGDAIQYLRERDGLSYGEACARLGVTPGVHVDGRGSGARQGEGTRSGGGQVRRDGEVVPAGPCAPTTMSPLMPPPAAWQERGAYHAARCAAHLWGEEGGRARAYLQGRGLFDGVLRAFQVGYNPGDVYEERGLWGLAEGGHKNLAAAGNHAALADRGRGVAAQHPPAAHAPPGGGGGGQVHRAGGFWQRAVQRLSNAARHCTRDRDSA